MEERLIVEKEIKSNAPTAKVWDILTKSEWTKQYMFGCEPVTVWNPESPILGKGASNGVANAKGNIKDIKARELLQYTTVNANSEYTDDPENYLTVTCKLHEQDVYTLLSVSQGDFSSVQNAEARYADAVGNWDMVLPKIEELAESKKKYLMNETL